MTASALWQGMHLRSPCCPLFNTVCCSIEAQPEGAVSPGTSISVSAKIRRNQAPVASVTLLVRAKYAAEQRIPMTASGAEGKCWHLGDVCSGDKHFGSHGL